MEGEISRTKQQEHRKKNRKEIPLLGLGLALLFFRLDFWVKKPIVFSYATLVAMHHTKPSWV